MMVLLVTFHLLTCLHSQGMFYHRFSLVVFLLLSLLFLFVCLFVFLNVHAAQKLVSNELGFELRIRTSRPLIVYRNAGTEPQTKPFHS